MGFGDRMDYTDEEDEPGFIKALNCLGTFILGVIILGLIGFGLYHFILLLIDAF